jgi:hypothetical protein
MPKENNNTGRKNKDQDLSGLTLEQVEYLWRKGVMRINVSVLAEMLELRPETIIAMFRSAKRRKLTKPTRKKLREFGLPNLDVFLSSDDEVVTSSSDE